MHIETGAHLRYRPGDAEVDLPREPEEDAVYRVVGTADGLTLLRVMDADGRRRYAGEIVTVAPETGRAAFEPADNPDAGLALGHRCRTMASGAYWSVRRYLP